MLFYAKIWPEAVGSSHSSSPGGWFGFAAGFSDSKTETSMADNNSFPLPPNLVSEIAGQSISFFYLQSAQNHFPPQPKQPLI